MALKTYRVVYELMGENSDTPYTPRWLYTRCRATIHMDEQIQKCFSFDDNRPVLVNRYKMLRVSIPDWLRPSHWIAEHLSWSWAWAAGVDPEWPEAWQRSIAFDLHHSQHRIAVVELLRTQRFRSDFRRSLRDQIVAWMETAREDRQFASPLSFSQWGKLITGRHMQAAAQLDATLGNLHRCTEDRGLAIEPAPATEQPIAVEPAIPADHPAADDLHDLPPALATSYLYDFENPADPWWVTVTAAGSSDSRRIRAYQQAQRPERASGIRHYGPFDSAAAANSAIDTLRSRIMGGSVTSISISYAVTEVAA